MARRGLNNVIRKEVVRNGQTTWSLTTCSGEPVHVFDTYCEKNIDYRFPTQKRYAETVSRFIDYLYETKALGYEVTPRHLNTVIDFYPILLRDGSEITASRIRKSNRDIWLAEVVERLKAWLLPSYASDFRSPTAGAMQFMTMKHI